MQITGGRGTSLSRMGCRNRSGWLERVTAGRMVGNKIGEEGRRQTYHRLVCHNRELDFTQSMGNCWCLVSSCTYLFNWVLIGGVTGYELH